MIPFKTLHAITAPLPIDNVDTDMIIPKQFLKTIKRTGLREGLFFEMRYTVEGVPIADFVLNRAPYDKAQILVAYDNFGCGSSREHAPWALLDFGIRCVIAPSFADIFYNNCFKNGILPIVLPREQVEQLMQHAQSSSNAIAVDLASQTVKAGNHAFEFNLDAFRKKCLMEGLDDIGLTLAKSASIDAFEATRSKAMPWMNVASA
ncbi:MAG: 3-isopropylmalate dehydratase small subunit [Rhodospirillales bacterium 12-54-5]|nr:MAG: 3-isopropylmalate dehydratase small subunit [Rhodospirillales bacterium 12-54-5]